MHKIILYFVSLMSIIIGVVSCNKQDEPGFGISTIMPGESYFSILSQPSRSINETSENLLATVKTLSVEIGERNIENIHNLEKAAEYIEKSLIGHGYKPRYSPYELESLTVNNIYAVKSAVPKTNKTIVIGSHYDSLSGTVGANDNASGVAVLLELARLLKNTDLDVNIHFAAFVNEEPPFFQTNSMGSMVYAKQLRQQGVDVIAMYSLETMGAYYDQRGTQSYPYPLGKYYPDTGNFIGFVSNTHSGDLLKKSIKIFREVATIPSEGLVAPEEVEGVSWSDHWSFWQEGYPAIMITDTAPFRYDHYHKTTDTFDKIDYLRMARVTHGISYLIQKIAKSD